MARKTKVIVVCDRHRGEVPAAGSVEVVVNGDRRSVDLCAEHLAEFRRAIRPWLGTGRASASGARRGRAAASGAKKAAPRRRAASAETAAIREWAKANGWELGERGRLPAAVREAYAAKH